MISAEHAAFGDNWPELLGLAVLDVPAQTTVKRRIDLLNSAQVMVEDQYVEIVRSLALSWEAQEVSRAVRCEGYRKLEHVVSALIPSTRKDLRSTFELTDSNGVVLQIQTRDYLLTASSLNGPPKAGDRILDGERVYEVSDFGSEPAWRWSDSFRQTYRIHTKEVKQ